MLDRLLEWVTGGLSGLTDNLLTIGLALFALVLGFFSVHYLGKRREMLHQERMASMIKGLHYAGVAPQVFGQKKKSEPREHALRGMRWLFGGAGLSGALYGYEALEPSAAAASEPLRAALAGIIPGFIGLAHLLFSWACSRRERKEKELLGSRMVYRAVARR